MAAAALDLIVYGASSFVGRLLARELMLRFGVDGSLRWALAGRDKDKMDALRTELAQLTEIPGGHLLELA